MSTKENTKTKQAPEPANSGKTFKRKSNRAKDLTGKQFGRLKVLHDSGERINKRIMWTCRCECGQTKNVRSSHLIGGKIVSCGCLKAEAAAQRAADPDANNGAVFKSHGMSDDRIYRMYRGMLQRCYNPSTWAYQDYGARGITVCDQWQGPGGFEQFIEDMGYPSDDTLSIDREDNNGHYTPENCRWATRKEQARNRRNNRIVTWQGQERLLIELAEEYDIPYKELHRRYVGRSWPLERALTQPMR